MTENTSTDACPTVTVPQEVQDLIVRTCTDLSALVLSSGIVQMLKKLDLLTKLLEIWTAGFEAELIPKNSVEQEPNNQKDFPQPINVPEIFLQNLLKWYECSKCHKSFHNSSLLKRHMTVHSSEQLIHLKVHETKGISGKELEKDEPDSLKVAEAGSSEVAFDDEAALVCSSEEQLELEKNVAGNDFDQKLPLCVACGMHFANVLEMQLHHRTDSQYICCVCKKIFSRLSSLKNHLKTHSYEKPYLCCECGEQFSLPSELHMHVVLHLEENPLACNVCGRIFSQASYLRRHLLGHTGAKPHCCTSCAKQFRRLYDLHAHELLHTKDNPFTCRECGRGFSRSKDLLRHESIHTGERLHQCGQCGKCFRRADGLKEHVVSHQAHSCKECGTVLNSFRELRKHMKNTHASLVPYECSRCGVQLREAKAIKRHIGFHGTSEGDC